MKMTTEYNNQTEQPEFIEGLALTGAEAEGAKDKSFEIVSIPEYETFQDEKEGAKRRLKMSIIFNKAKVTYYPNKSSQGKIVAHKGRRLEEWVGFKGEFEVLKQKIGSETKSVIYVK